MTVATASAPPVLLTRPYHGMGDNILQRPFVRKLAQTHPAVWLSTPWPQMYQDIPNLRLLQPHTTLRTQAQNVAHSSGSLWSHLPADTSNLKRVVLNYQEAYRLGRSLVDVFQEQVPLAEGEFDMSFPLRPAWLRTAGDLLARINPKRRPAVLLHRPTLRREWYYPTRNPRTKYLQAIVDRFDGEVFFFDVVDLARGEEWHEGTVHGLQASLGALPVETMWALVALADAVVTGPCCFLYLALALGTPVLCLFGGFAAPHHLLDRRMPLERVRTLAPEPFCNCLRPQHDCHKTLDPDVFDATVDAFFSALNSSLKPQHSGLLHS